MSSYIDPDVQILLDAVALSDITPIYRLTPDEARRQFLRDEFDTMIKPVPVGRVEDFTIDGPGGALPIRLYRPTHGDDPLPVVVYFHGGGFVIGDLESYDSLCRVLCERSGCLVLSVDYRLAPENRFPAAVDDAFAAYTWAAGHAKDFGGDPARIAVAGDSAGGTLAAVVCHLVRDGDVAGPAAQVLLYPAVDIGDGYPSRRALSDMIPIPKKVIDWFYGHYLGDTGPTDDPRVAPIRYARFEGLPPAQIITAGLDPLRDEGEAYAAKLRDAGVPVDYKCYDGVIHAFIGLGGVLRVGSDAMDTVAAYLAKTLSSPGY